MQQLKTKTEFKYTEIGLIPEEWEVKTIDEITTYVSRGITPKYTEENGILVINQRCVRDGSVDITVARLTDPEKKKVSQEKLLQSFDILINSTGTGTLGRVSQLKEVNMPLTLDSHVTVVRINPADTLPRYIGYYLKSIQKYIEDLAEGSTGQTELSREKVKQIVVPLPSYPEQKAIAEILSSLDEKIELNRRMNKTLEEMGKALFKRWFVDFEFLNEDGKPYKSSGGKMMDSELGEIPEGWEVKPLKNVCQSITNGGTPSRSKSEFWDEGTIPWVKTGELSDTVITRAEECINDLGLKSSATRLLPVNSIIVAIYAAPTVGRLGIIKVPSATNQACTGLVADEDQISYLHLYYFLLFNRKYFNNISVGAAQQNISKQVIEDTLIVIPSDYRIVESSKDKFELLWNQIHSIHKENQVLMSLRDSLLPRLISGRIRTQYEN